jgi:hypothetical protein
MTPTQKIAEKMICDLCKKFAQLQQMEPKTRNRILEGLIAGLCGGTQPYPDASLDLPPIRPAFDAPFEAGYDVGQTWARIAKDANNPPK